MDPFETRGYVFGTTLKCVRESLPPERRRKTLERISPETIADVGDAEFERMWRT